MRGQRGQWAGEGYIISVLTTVIGMSFLYLNNIDRFAVDKSQQRMLTVMTLMGIYMMF